MDKTMVFLIGSLILSFAGLVFAESKNSPSGDMGKGVEKATFAGGCFWCMESPYDKLEGVLSTTVGYTGGEVANPTYEEVCSGRTGHAEAIEIRYNPSRITYAELLDVFWKNITPTQANGQFVDIGNQYRSAIFYHNEEQKRLAEASKTKLEESGRFGKKIMTEIVPASIFYPAEEYHQEFYRKSPDHYRRYRQGSGRDQYLKEKWGKDCAH